MSRREVRDCDRCGLKNISSFEMSLCVGRRTDAAGSAEDINENIDLCGECVKFALALLMTERNGWTREYQKALAAKLKGAKS